MTEYDTIPSWSHSSYNFVFVTDGNDESLVRPFFDLGDALQSTLEYEIVVDVVSTTALDQFSFFYDPQTKLLSLLLSSPSSLLMLDTGLAFKLRATQLSSQCYTNGYSSSGGCSAVTGVNYARIINNSTVNCSSDRLVSSSGANVYWTAPSIAGEPLQSNVQSGHYFPPGVTTVMYVPVNLQAYQLRKSASVCAFNVRFSHFLS